jgi:ribosomal protein L24
LIAGKDKFRIGSILAFSSSGDYIKVEGVNLVKNHVKPNQVKT